MQRTAPLDETAGNRMIVSKLLIVDHYFVFLCFSLTSHSEKNWVGHIDAYLDIWQQRNKL